MCFNKIVAVVELGQPHLVLIEKRVRFNKIVAVVELRELDLRLIAQSEGFDEVVVVELGQFHLTLFKQRMGFHEIVGVVELGQPQILLIREGVGFNKIVAVVELRELHLRLIAEREGLDETVAVVEARELQIVLIREGVGFNKIVAVVEARQLDLRLIAEREGLDDVVVEGAQRDPTVRCARRGRLIQTVVVGYQKALDELRRDPLLHEGLVDQIVVEVGEIHLSLGSLRPLRYVQIVGELGKLDLTLIGQSERFNKIVVLELRERHVASRGMNQGAYVVREALQTDLRGILLDPRKFVLKDAQHGLAQVDVRKRAALLEVVVDGSHDVVRHVATVEVGVGSFRGGFFGRGSFFGRGTFVLLKLDLLVGFCEIGRVVHAEILKGELVVADSDRFAHGNQIEFVQIDRKVAVLRLSLREWVIGIVGASDGVCVGALEESFGGQILLQLRVDGAARALHQGYVLQQLRPLRVQKERVLQTVESAFGFDQPQRQLHYLTVVHQHRRERNVRRPQGDVRYDGQLLPQQVRGDELIVDHDVSKLHSEILKNDLVARGIFRSEHEAHDVQGVGLVVEWIADKLDRIGTLVRQDVFASVGIELAHAFYGLRDRHRFGSQQQGLLGLHNQVVVREQLQHELVQTAGWLANGHRHQHGDLVLLSYGPYHQFGGGSCGFGLRFGFRVFDGHFGADELSVQGHSVHRAREQFEPEVRNGDHMIGVPLFQDVGEQVDRVHAVLQIVSVHVCVVVELRAVVVEDVLARVFVPRVLCKVFVLQTLGHVFDVQQNSLFVGVNQMFVGKESQSNEIQITQGFLQRHRQQHVSVGEPQGFQNTFRDTRVSCARVLPRQLQIGDVGRGSRVGVFGCVKHALDQMFVKRLVVFETGQLNVLLIRSYDPVFDQIVMKAAQTHSGGIRTVIVGLSGEKDALHQLGRDVRIDLRLDVQIVVELRELQVRLIGERVRFNETVVLELRELKIGLIGERVRFNKVVVAELGEFDFALIAEREGFHEVVVAELGEFDFALIAECEEFDEAVVLELGELQVRLVGERVLLHEIVVKKLGEFDLVLVGQGEGLDKLVVQKLGEFELALIGERVEFDKLVVSKVGEVELVLVHQRMRFEETVVLELRELQVRLVGERVRFDEVVVAELGEFDRVLIGQGEGFHEVVVAELGQIHVVLIEQRVRFDEAVVLELGELQGRLIGERVRFDELVVVQKLGEFDLVLVGASPYLGADQIDYSQTVLHQGGHVQIVLELRKLDVALIGEGVRSHKTVVVELGQPHLVLIEQRVRFDEVVVAELGQQELVLVFS